MAKILYYLLKPYVKLMHDRLLYRKRYIIGLENLPGTDERYFIAVNHENTGNDPVNVAMSLPFGIKMSAMARADLFKIHPLLTHLIRWFGLVPAYRAGWEGASGLDNNFDSFDEVARRVNECSPLLICHRPDTRRATIPSASRPAWRALRSSRPNRTDGRRT